MKRLLYAVCALAVLVSCERSAKMSGELIPVSDGYFLKEYTINPGGLNSRRYAYLLVDKDGTPIQGTSTTYPAGKTTESTTSVVKPDDTEYRYYKKLKEKYENKKE